MKKQTILVTGASGLIGSETVRILKSQGFDIRTTTSKLPSEPGQFQVDFASGAGLDSALEGVDRAFFLSPAGHADQYRILSPLIAKAVEHGLEKVVLMTAMGANADETSPFRRAEVELEKSGLNYAIIRPNWFYQNFHTFWISGIHLQGKILLPAGEAKVSFIDARDISAVAARLLTNEMIGAFDLTGPDSIDHAEVAAAISRASGKKIGYAEIAPAEFKMGLVGAGLPEAYVDFLVLIFGYLKAGYSARVTTSVQDILGRKPIGAAKYAADYKEAFA